MRDLVHLEEYFEEDGVNVDSLACVRRELWSMLYADDAGIVSKSQEGLATMMTVIVTISEQQQASPCPKRKRRSRYCGH